MRRAHALLAVLVVLLAACGAAATPTPSPTLAPTATPSPSPSPSPTSTPVPLLGIGLFDLTFSSYDSTPGLTCGESPLADGRRRVICDADSGDATVTLVAVAGNDNQLLASEEITIRLSVPLLSDVKASFQQFKFDADLDTEQQGGNWFVSELQLYDGLSASTSKLLVLTRQTIELKFTGIGSSVTFTMRAAGES